MPMPPTAPDRRWSSTAATACSDQHKPITLVDMTGKEVLYDTSNPEFQTTLWDVYRAMRDEHPVYHDPDQGFYALTRFADVWAAAADHQTLSSKVGEANELLPQLIYMDPPRQTALRKLVSRVFTARRVAAMEDEVGACIDRLIDNIAAKGTCEFQHEYAAVIPDVVVGGMIGLDEKYLVPMRELDRVLHQIDGQQRGRTQCRGEYLHDVCGTTRRASPTTTRGHDDRTPGRRDRRRTAD